jgi:hypothetical protein
MNQVLAIIIKIQYLILLKVIQKKPIIIIKLKISIEDNKIRIKKNKNKK